MKKSDIKPGQIYSTKVDSKATQVRIEAVRSDGGWDATNLRTNRKVRIRDVGQLAESKQKSPSSLGTASTQASPGTPKKTRSKPAPKTRVEKTSAGTSGGGGERGRVKKKSTAAERRARQGRDERVRSAATSAKPLGVKDAKPASKPKPLSLIESAAKVLAESKEPLSATEMVDRVVSQGLWSPKRGGKTPHATLYSAILRDMKKQDANGTSRFEKVGRGRFQIVKGG